MRYVRRCTRTHYDGQLLAKSRRDKPEDDAPNRDPHPVARSHHAARKVSSFAHFEHELDDPAAEGNLNADVAQQEHGADPSDARVGHAYQSFLHTAVFAVGRALVVPAEHGACGRPECSD